MNSEETEHLELGIVGKNLAKVQDAYFQRAKLFLQFPLIRNRSFFTIKYGIESCQFMALTLSSRMAWSQSGDLSFFSQALDIFLLPFTKTFNAGLFWTVTSLCLSYSTLLFLLPFIWRKWPDRRPRLRFLVKSIRNVYRAFSSVLFLPLLCTLLAPWRPNFRDLSDFADPLSIHRIFGTVTCAMLSLSVIPFTLLVINTNPLASNKDVNACPHGRSRCFTKITQLFMAIGFISLPDSIVHRSIFHLFVFSIAVLVALSVFYYLPYYNISSNCIASFHATSFLVSSCFALAAHLFLPNHFGLTISAIVFSFLLGAAGAFIPLLTKRILTNWPKSALPDSPFHAEIIGRLAIQSREQSQKQRLSSSSSISVAVGEQDPQLAAINEIYARAGSQYFPKSSFVHFSHALFLFHVKEDQATGFSVLHRAEAVPRGFDLKFHISYLRAQFQSERGQKAFNNKQQKGDFLSLIEFQRSFESAKKLQKEAKEKLFLFWDTMFLDCLAPESEEAMNLVGELESITKKAKHLYRFLLRKYPASPKIMRSYAKFLRDVTQDTLQANKVMEKASEAQDEMAKRMASDSATDDHVRADLLDEICGIFTINQRGIIQSANKKARDMFGYQKSQIIGENVKMLMPNPYCRHHDGYLQRYAETNNPHVVGKGQRFVMGKHSSGTVVPLKLAVHRVDIGHDVLFTGIIHPVPAHVILLTVTTHDLKITGANDRACKVFNRLTKFFIGKHVEQFIPELSKHLDALKLIGRWDAATVNVRTRRRELFDIELAQNAEGGMEVYIITLRPHEKKEDFAATELSESSISEEEQEEESNAQNTSNPDVRLGNSVGSLFEKRVGPELKSRLIAALTATNSVSSLKSLDSSATTTAKIDTQNFADIVSPDKSTIGQITPTPTPPKFLLHQQSQTPSQLELDQRPTESVAMRYSQTNPSLYTSQECTRGFMPSSTCHDELTTSVFRFSTSDTNFQHFNPRIEINLLGLDNHDPSFLSRTPSFLSSTISSSLPPTARSSFYLPPVERGGGGGSDQMNQQGGMGQEQSVTAKFSEREERQEKGRQSASSEQKAAFTQFSNHRFASTLWNSKSEDTTKKIRNCKRLKNRIKKAMEENETCASILRLQKSLFWVFLGILLCACALFVFAIPTFDSLRTQIATLDFLGSSLVYSAETALHAREIATAQNGKILSDPQALRISGRLWGDVAARGLAEAVTKFKELQDSVYLDGNSPFPSVQSSFQDTQHQFQQLISNPGNSQISSFKSNLWEATSQFSTSGKFCVEHYLNLNLDLNSTSLGIFSTLPIEPHYFFLIENGPREIFLGLLSTIESFSREITENSPSTISAVAASLFLIPTCTLFFSFIFVILPTLRTSSKVTSRIAQIFSELSPCQIPGGLSKRVLTAQQINRGSSLSGTPTRPFSSRGNSKNSPLREQPELLDFGHHHNDDAENSSDSGSSQFDSPQNNKNDFRKSQILFENEISQNPILRMSLLEIQRQRSDDKMNNSEKNSPQQIFSRAPSPVVLKTVESQIIENEIQIGETGKSESQKSLSNGSAFSFLFTPRRGSGKMSDASWILQLKNFSFASSSLRESVTMTNNGLSRTSSSTNLKTQVSLATWRREMNLTKNYCFGFVAIALLFLAFAAFMIACWSLRVSPSVRTTRDSYQRHAHVLQSLLLYHDLVYPLNFTRVDGAKMEIKYSQTKIWEIQKSMANPNNILNSDIQKSLFYSASMQDSQVSAYSPTLFSSMHDLLSEISETVDIYLHVNEQHSSAEEYADLQNSLEYVTGIVQDLRLPLQESTNQLLSDFRANSDSLRSVACFMAAVTVGAILLIYIFPVRGLVKKIESQKHNFLFLLLLIPDEAIITDPKISKPLSSFVSQL